MLDEFVDEVVFKGFSSGEIEITFDVFAQAIFWLTGRSVQHFDLCFSKTPSLYGLNFQVGDVAFSFPEGLMEHQGSKLIGASLSGTGGENFTCTGERMPQTNCIHRRFDTVHDRNDAVGIVAVAAGGIDIQIYRCLGTALIELEQALDHRQGNFIFQSSEDIDIAIAGAAFRRRFFSVLDFFRLMFFLH